MAKFERFEDIEAWKKARELVRLIYCETSRGAFAQDFTLREQLRRAAISIMSNIAEGYERDGNREFRQFLSLAKGSAGEIRSQLYVALDNHYIDERKCDELMARTIEVSKILSGLMRYLESTTAKGRKFS
jgi:four helix bundle protein